MLVFDVQEDTNNFLDGVDPAKPWAHPTNNLYTPFVLDKILSYWKIEYRRLGWSSLWKIWFSLPQTRVLLRRAPSSGKDAGWFGWPVVWIQRPFRVQKWRSLPPGSPVCRHEGNVGGIWCGDGAPGVVYCCWVGHELAGLPSRRFDGAVWYVYPTKIDITLLTFS